MHARPKSRGNRWLPLLFIAIIGLTVGLTYAWFINPVQYVDVEPSQLAEEQRRTFLILVSLTYASDGNIDGARLRLAALGLQDPAADVAKAAEDAVPLGLPETSVRALTNLALALGGQPEVAAAFAGPVVSPTQSISSPASQATIPAVITVTPSLTPTLLATLTPSTTTPEDGEGTPSATPQQQQFVLVDLTTFCDEEHIPGIIVIQVQDADGSGLTGVEVRVEWEGSQDNFFTGLKPEQPAGQADFSMTEGELYRVRLVDGEITLSSRSEEISSVRCISESDGDSQLLAYRLVYRRSN